MVTIKPRLEEAGVCVSFRKPGEIVAHLVSVG